MTMTERYEGEPVTFHVRVDDGPEETITVKTSIYTWAVAALPAILGYELPIVVEIWVPRLLPEYGPYLYRVETDEYVRLVTNSVIRVGGGEQHGRDAEKSAREEG